jgi:hypothetical protein
MNAATWLRVAAGLTLFQAIGHTFGAVLAPPSHGPGEVALRQAMQAYRVVEMGVERSYWDFYYGSGWTITVLVIALAAVMWFVAPLARRFPRDVRPLIAALALANAALTMIGVLFFVTAPIVASAAITVSLVLAFFRTGEGAVSAG